MNKLTKTIHQSKRVLTDITINAKDLHRFSCLIDDSDNVIMTGSDDPEDGMVTVHISCQDYKVARDMERGWA